MRAERLLETAIYGPDLDALERFYVDLLGLEPVARTVGRNVVLRCGASALILFDPDASGAPGGPFPAHGTRGAGHVAFTVPLADFPGWRARLSSAGVAIEAEKEWPDGHRSLYFRDPAGNSVELAPPTLWEGLGHRGVAPIPPGSAHSVSDETLKAILDAFNTHDPDAIMAFFADDCSFDMPRGPEPWGQRFIGRAAVREALATRFRGLPDVHYGEDRHWVGGDLAVSEWLLTGTTPEGRRVRVRGCDHWEFRDGMVVRKDSYWKIVEPPPA